MTAFGKAIRIMRIERNETLKDMAKKLGVSSAYVSAVETGRTCIPPDWANAIAAIYDLNDDEKYTLEETIRVSAEHVYINLRTVNNTRRSLAVLLARKLNTMSDELACDIRGRLLNAT